MTDKTAFARAVEAGLQAAVTSKPLHVIAPLTQDAALTSRRNILEATVEWPEVVRAVLMAIRPPSAEMCVAGTEDWLVVRAMEDRAEVIWQAMIDHILAEGTET